MNGNVLIFLVITFITIGWILYTCLPKRNNKFRKYSFLDIYIDLLHTILILKLMIYYNSEINFFQNYLIFIYIFSGILILLDIVGYFLNRKIQKETEIFNALEKIKKSINRSNHE